MKFFSTLILLITLTIGVNGQSKLDNLHILIGKWSGAGSGFGNTTSTIKSQFDLVMNGKYIHVSNDSKFKPTDSKPEGENHIGWGMISYDKKRDKIVFRQFNTEGYVNRYVLIDSLSNDSGYVFETEEIENFIEGGKARWTINILSENEIETVFDLSFPGKGYTCFGRNLLRKDK